MLEDMSQEARISCISVIIGTIIVASMGLSVLFSNLDVVINTLKINITWSNIEWTKALLIGFIISGCALLLLYQFPITLVHRYNTVTLSKHQSVFGIIMVMFGHLSILSGILQEYPMNVHFFLAMISASSFFVPLYMLFIYQYRKNYYLLIWGFIPISLSQADGGDIGGVLE